MRADFVSRDGFAVRVVATRSNRATAKDPEENLITIGVGGHESYALSTDDIEQLEHLLRCVREQAERDNRRLEAARMSTT